MLPAVPAQLGLGFCFRPWSAQANYQSSSICKTTYPGKGHLAFIWTFALPTYAPRHLYAMFDAKQRLTECVAVEHLGG